MHRLHIGTIPAFLYGGKTGDVYLAIHGKMGSKEDCLAFARKAEMKGYRTLAFDLPGHGGRSDRFSIEAGMRDLHQVMDYARTRWRVVGVHAVSLGAFLALMSYGNDVLERCLFLSPVLDMAFLIRKMMAVDHITEEALKRKGSIPSSFGEVLDWASFRLVVDHPVSSWATPTAILYGERDTLVDRSTVESFSRRFGCRLTIAQACEHWFHTPAQMKVFDSWLDEEL